MSKVTSRWAHIAGQITTIGVCLIVLLGIGAVITQRQIRLRGALDGLPPASLPERPPILGINADLTQYTNADLNQNLDQIAAAGFVWVRQIFVWQDIEPERGQYQWDVTDRIMDGMAKRHLRPLIVLWGSPHWAAESPASPPADMMDFARFASAVALRYGDQGEVYQIWDEPNLASGWGGQSPDPIRYAEMLETAYTAIRRADLDAVILTAGLAPTIETGPDNLSDILFLRALYDNGAQSVFDGVAAKPYGFDTGPDDRQVDPNVLNFSRMVLLREEMERHGDANKLLWATQFGWNSLPDGWQGEPSLWGQVNAQTQANWTIAAYQRALLEWAWSGPLILENWQSPQDSKNNARWGFSVRGQDGILSLSGRAIASHANVFNTGLWPGIYQPQTPLARYSGTWEFSELGADFSQQGDSVVEVPVAGDQLAVTVRRDNYRAYLYVTVDGQPSNTLPADSRGTYLVLTSGDLKPHMDTLTIVDSLTRDQIHTVRIEAERGWDQWALVGFAVGSKVDTRDYDLALAGLIVLGTISLAGIIRTRALDLPAQVIRSALAKLGELAYWLISLAVALVAWTGMALTWGGEAPAFLRRIGDGGTLLITALTAGVFYFSPWFLLTLLALAVLFVLILSRPTVGLGLILFFTPYYLLPRPLFDRLFGMLEIVSLLTLAVCAIHITMRWRTSGIPSPRAFWNSLTLLDKAVIGFAGLAGLAVSWSDLKGVALTDLRQMVIEPAVIYLLIRTVPPTRPERWMALSLWITTGVIVAGVGFYQFSIDWVNSPGTFTCLRSVFGTCNNAALYLIRLIPMCAAIVLMYPPTRIRSVYGAAGVMMLAAVGLTVSRGGILFGLPAALALVLIVWGGQRGLFIALAGLILEIVIFVPLVMFVPRFANMFDTSSGSSSSFFRTQLWQSTFQMLRDHPLTGVGMDQFLYQYRGFYILPDAWQQPDLSQPHNFIINYWVRMGICGVAIGLWLQGLFWRMSFRAQSMLRNSDPQNRMILIGLMGGMAAMVAHGMVDETHFVIDLATIYFFTLGTAQLIAQEAEDGKSDSGQNAAAG